MARKRAENQPDSRVFMSLALEPEEAERYVEVLRRALQHRPQASKSDIIRSLFRFPGSNPKLVTKADRDFFYLRSPFARPGAESDDESSRKSA